MLSGKNSSVALLPVIAFLAGTSHAETAVYNANAYTPTEDGVRQFSTLIIGDDGKIIATGETGLLEDYTDAKQIDAGGKTLLPGLIDSHAHVYDLGLLKSNLDLTGVRSIADAVAEISKYASSKPYAQWILGRGWNQVLWRVKEFPNAAHIDAVVSDRPVWLRRIDGHAGWANSAALSLAGIDDDTTDPIGGRIIRDDNGHATGVLVDKAMDLMTTQLPAPGKSDVRDAIRAAIDALIAEGMTGVHDAGIDLMTAEVYLSMADNEELDMRIYAMIGGAGSVLDEIGEPIRSYGNDRLEIAAVKLYSDGALGSRGAAMLQPYSDDVENRGLPYWTQEELNSFVEKANNMGFQVGIHAIGDMGNRMALDAFEKVQGGSPSGLRNRIEHAQIIAMNDIPRFAELGVIASMQATHATSDKNMAENRVGPDRILGGYAWRRLLDSGAVLANGSDFPVELSNPFHGLYASVTRQGRDGEPEGGWYIDQALTRAEALHSFTLAAAFAAHQEDRTGSLEAGKWADFIIIDRDYFTIPASEIDDIKVLETWVGGEQVYEISAAEDTT